MYNQKEYIANWRKVNRDKIKKQRHEYWKLNKPKMQLKNYKGKDKKRNREIENLT